MLQIKLQEAQRRMSALSQAPSPGYQRPSEYFGALHIDRLNENEAPDPKLT